MMKTHFILYEARIFVLPSLDDLALYRIFIWHGDPHLVQI